MRYLVLFFGLVVSIYSQGCKPLYQTNPKLNLDSVLLGVKHVMVNVGSKVQEDIDKGNKNELAEVTRNYLTLLGFESIGLTQEKRNIINSLKSYCDLISFDFDWEYAKKTHIIVFLTFVTCNEDTFHFSSINPISDVNDLTTEQFYNYLFKKWRQIYSKERPRFQPDKRLKLPALTTNWTEVSLKQYFNTSPIDSVEGIYEKMRINIEDTDPKYKIAIVKTDQLSYNVLYLSGATYIEDWQEGEIKAVLFKSAVPNYYKVNWYMQVKNLNSDVFLQRTPEGILEFLFTDDGPSRKSSYLKTFPVKW